MHVLSSLDGWVCKYPGSSGHMTGIGICEVTCVVHWKFYEFVVLKNAYAHSPFMHFSYCTVCARIRYKSGIFFKEISLERTVWYNLLQYTTVHCTARFTTMKQHDRTHHALATRHFHANNLIHSHVIYLVR